MGNNPLWLFGGVDQIPPEMQFLQHASECVYGSPPAVAPQRQTGKHRMQNLSSHLYSAWPGRQFVARLAKKQLPQENWPFGSPEGFFRTLNVVGKGSTGRITDA